jgi:uncharacterized protein YndB with AHSA1/START domain
MTDRAAFPADRELVLTRLIDASPDKVFRCWTDPELITRWFTPPPFTTPRAELDVRAGGSNLIVMKGPDGVEIANHGIYLEVVENQRLVWTDAFVRAWEPSEQPFITTILTFEEDQGKTRYTARVRHWSVADRQRHEEMGFREGWGVATDQLEAVAKEL